MWQGIYQSKQQVWGLIVNTSTRSSDAVTSPIARIVLVEKKALLSALWMFNLLNHIFRGIHEIVKVVLRQEATNGSYNGVEVTDAMFLLGGIMIQPPIVMIVLVWLLPLRANRWANIIVAPLFGLTLIGQPGDLDDYLHVGLEWLALAVIVWQAWRWKSSNS